MYPGSEVEVSVV